MFGIDASSHQSTLPLGKNWAEMWSFMLLRIIAQFARGVKMLPK